MVAKVTPDTLCVCGRVISCGLAILLLDHDHTVFSRAVPFPVLQSHICKAKFAECSEAKPFVVG